MEDLVTELKILREKFAKSENLPAYCVFSDKSLYEIVKYLPKNFEELKNINGFKERRIEKYGQEIISLITLYIQNNNIDKDSLPDNTDEIEQIILDCIEMFNGSYGKAGIVKILKGSKNSMIVSSYKEEYNADAINSRFFGMLENITGKNIDNAIDKLINENKVLKTDD